MDTTKKLTTMKLSPTSADSALPSLMAREEASTTATVREQIEGLNRTWSPSGVDSAFRLLMQALKASTEEELNQIINGRLIRWSDIWEATCLVFSLANGQQPSNTTTFA